MAEKQSPALSARAERNLAIATSVHKSWAAGYTEGMTVDLSILSDAIADDMVLYHPEFGEVQIGRYFAEGLVPEIATMELRAWWRAFPDICMDKFLAFPTDEGVAYHVRMGGHARADGRWLEFWECNFWTINDEGKITRFEVFHLGKNYDEMCEMALGFTGKDLTPESYRAAVLKNGGAEA
ncbi:MAG: nuclear transport factor 2 family protein [Sphingobium sp.]|uniref:nuclear transport factor 2 family protein n=1 Tax=Sphingobium sp. TaxID=1912891 RepID=UPI0029A8C029|nr:nuclear transport factor 2 family protein [Sphingobium sp.]MDX3910848.1 nuclear transport factor 2 family protein [Sphingobium sp.]